MSLNFCHNFFHKVYCTTILKLVILIKRELIKYYTKEKRERKRERERRKKKRKFLF